MSDIWILVADGARARLFSLPSGRRKADEMEEIDDFVNAEGRMPGRELERDRRPRAHHIGEARHAIEARSSPREKSTMRFADLLADTLERGRVEHRYRRLVLIAAPGFLGTLRAELGDQVRSCVALEIPKDLSAADAKTIFGELPDSLLWSVGG